MVMIRSMLIFLTFSFLISCNKAPNEPKADSSKEIVSFNLKMANGVLFDSTQVSVKIQGTSIEITLPFNSDLSQLIPVIVFKGKSILPSSEVIQNFSIPIIYNVTAMDGSSVKYTVTVHTDNTPPPIVYFGSSNNFFYALNALNGSLIWKFESTKPFMYLSASYNNGVIYMAGVDGYVYAFDALTGSIKWKNLLTTIGIESNVVFNNGILYVGANDHYFYALDANTGAIKWRFLTGGNVSSSPTLLNDIVYFGSSDGKLYCLNATNGQLKWYYQTGDMINHSGPALVNGIIYFGSRDKNLYAINANAGTLVWKYSSNNISLEMSSPTVSNGIVYIAGWYNTSNFSEKGSLLAIDALTGKLVWEKLPNTGFGSSPCVTNGLLYISGDDMNEYAINAINGEIIWSKQILPNNASPVVSNGIVYVGGGGTWYFYALDAKTGAEKWKFNTPNGTMTTSALIVTQNGTPIFSGDSGSIQ